MNLKQILFALILSLSATSDVQALSEKRELSHLFTPDKSKNERCYYFGKSWMYKKDSEIGGVELSISSEDRNVWFTISGHSGERGEEGKTANGITDKQKYVLGQALIEATLLKYT